MRLVVDANVLFSALIKDSVSAELLLSKDLELYTPMYILSELAKYDEALRRKTHREKEDYENLIGSFNEVIKIMANEELSAFWDEARLISPDPKDAMYFAAAILVGAPIWSNDKALKKQNRIRIYTTAELMELEL